MLGIVKIFVGRMVGSPRLEAAGVLDELLGRLDTAGKDTPARHAGNNTHRHARHERPENDAAKR
ncbi:MAG: hypothetical protein A3G24_17920 [Betaproteobacteria bacterium RIFCSPLOWO2_12_FULL_62_13]|nr:MAG: hypothetical protein A3G24_17920 [Betaproteobacteria bacterium RIFCSPLOWO2_12_FULL_62_13]